MKYRSDYMKPIGWDLRIFENALGLSWSIFRLTWTGWDDILMRIVNTVDSKYSTVLLLAWQLAFYEKYKTPGRKYNFDLFQPFTKTQDFLKSSSYIQMYIINWLIYNIYVFTIVVILPSQIQKVEIRAEFICSYTFDNIWFFLTIK